MAPLRGFSHALVLLTGVGLVMLAPTNAAHAACTTVLKVILNTFGEGVLVELRRGVPGTSRVVQNQHTTGGTVYFRNLCPDSYFMAIGNDESVEVTPVHQFNDRMEYTSTITLQHDGGNIARKPRKEL